MQINYLLAGVYGEEAARHIFETMCSLLILNKEKQLDVSSILNDDINDKQFENLGKDEGFQTFKLNLSRKVYHVQTRKGDGGLDILVEHRDLWSVYQCKFFVEGKLTTAKERGAGDYKQSNRIQQIEKSFDEAVKTAERKNKILNKWVLCTPKDLDNLEIKWLNDFKEKNKYRCKNIDFIGNLDLSNWLIENKNIYEYFFRRIIIEESDLQIRVFEKIREYSEWIYSDIFNAQDPSSTHKSNLSSYSELDLLINHIKEFRGEYMCILQDFKTIDQLSNYNKYRYEEYSKIKYNVDKKTRSNMAMMINKREEELIELTQKKEIINFIDYLKKVANNFNDYFSYDKL